MLLFGDWAVRDGIPLFVATHCRAVYEYNCWVTRMLGMRCHYLWLQITGWFINIIVG